MGNKKLVSFRLPEDLMEDLRVRADIDGISVTELVCRLLRQGVQVDQRTPEAQVNHRLASLEAEIKQLRQAHRANQTPHPYPIASTPLYALIAPNATATSEHDMKERIDRLEQLIEKFVTHNGFDDLDPDADRGKGKFDNSNKATSRSKRDD
jgi:plasmid stability protein